MREQAFVAFRSVADASAAMRAEGGREFFGREMVGAIPSFLFGDGSGGEDGRGKGERRGEVERREGRGAEEEGRREGKGWRAREGGMVG